MKKKNFRAAITLLFSLGLILSRQAVTQTQQPPPPEYKEIVAALKLEDLSARLKELERIKAAYPKSGFMEDIDALIASIKIDLSPSLETIIDIQKPTLDGGKGMLRIGGYYSASMSILMHKNLKQFDPRKVTEIIRRYTEIGRRLATDPEFLKTISVDEQKRIPRYLANLSLADAQAYVNEDSAVKALASLESFKKNDGLPSIVFFHTAAETYAKLGKTQEAYENYAAVATDTAGKATYPDALEKAKEYYQKVRGGADGFEAAMEAKQRDLPFKPETFKPAADWKGKTVLAELFTGSECPPCVGADIGFDGLIEAYALRYLAVLEYHLPIPAPDPMINPATKRRQDYYGVNSTPTVVVDGDKKMIGGGSRAMAEGKFKEYKTEIDARVNAVPAVGLKVKASRAGDSIKVEYDFGKALPGAEYNIALVQAEEKYKGSNGLPFHKFVVRDFTSVDPDAPRQGSFDLAASEQEADQYLTDFEKTYTRIPNFKWAERHARIDRAKLGVVFFVQDKETKKVLNAVVADVK